MFKLTPEAQARAAENKAFFDERKIVFANLSNDSLVSTAKLYMSNMEPRNYAPGEPVYDATMWHIILPELLRRLS